MKQFQARENVNALLFQLGKLVGETGCNDELSSKILEKVDGLYYWSYTLGVLDQEKLDEAKIKEKIKLQCAHCDKLFESERWRYFCSLDCRELNDEFDRQMEKDD